MQAPQPRGCCRPRASSSRRTQPANHYPGVIVTGPKPRDPSSPLPECARVEVWQPRHWLDGTIAAALAALHGRDAEVVVSGEPDPEKAFFRAPYGHR